MITLRTRSLSGARINDRRGGHTLTSLAGVQKTGCGTESTYQRYNIVSESDLRAAAEKTQLYLDTLPTNLKNR